MRGEVGRFGTNFYGKDLFPVEVHGAPRAERHEHHDAQHDHPLRACRHTETTQRSRSALISAFGFFAEKIALPATKASAPARHASPMVSRLMPPSTSST